MEIKLDKVYSRKSNAFCDNLQEELQVVAIGGEVLFSLQDEEELVFRTRKNDIKKYDKESAEERNIELRKSAVLKSIKRPNPNSSYDKKSSNTPSQSANLIKISSVII